MDKRSHRSTTGTTGAKPERDPNVPPAQDSRTDREATAGATNAPEAGTKGGVGSALTGNVQDKAYNEKEDPLAP